MAEVDVTVLAAARADGAVVIDVREPHEFEDGHVPGARLIPLSTVPYRVGDIPRDGRVYVICQSGNRSRVAAETLARAGREVTSVLGGTSAWVSAGHPVVRGPRDRA
ncbi:MAG: rhodanese-like domain-containing protein [Actinobacteria bacterium]|nr:rhodanese-like domain-containing protein [Actinomycetota bacterium]MBU4336542.1 rhodanese-like domain-containing protein [Actinomycetota bacterium]MCG2798373.1 rhodanese-like domain-containing protein [Cellulomonas sp.]